MSDKADNEASLAPEIRLRVSHWREFATCVLTSRPFARATALPVQFLDGRKQLNSS